MGVCVYVVPKYIGVVIMYEVGGLERGPLSLMRAIKELLEWKSSGFGLENRD
jgi:hypothetical protein